MRVDGATSPTAVIDVCPTTAGQTTIRHNADLVAFWSKLMGQDGFGLRTVWLVFLDGDNRTLPIIVPIEHVPVEPDGHTVRNLGKVVGELVSCGDAASVVILLSRPGTSSMTRQDRRWASVLRANLGAEFSNWPIHLATRGRIQMFAPHDLVAVS